MKRKSLLIATLITFVIPTLLFTQDLTQVTIYGVVTDSLTAQPLEGVLVEAINEADTSERASALTGSDGSYTLNMVTGLRSTQDEDQLPNEFRLLQNYPNPFNPSTTIRFQIPQNSKVKLVIYNTLGQKIRTLLDQPLTRDTYTVEWDGTNDAGTGVAAGIYFYRLQTKDNTTTRKMVLLDGHTGFSTSRSGSILSKEQIPDQSANLLVTIRATSIAITPFEKNNVTVTIPSLRYDMAVSSLPRLIDHKLICVSEISEERMVYIGGLPGAVKMEISGSETAVVTNNRLDARVSSIVNSNGSFPAMRMQTMEGDRLSITLYRDESPVSAPEDLIVPETAAPVVLDSKPTNGDKDIIVDAIIKVYFSEPIETASVNPNSFYLTDSLGNHVPGTIGFQEGNTVAYLDLLESLSYSSRYTITVTTDVTDLQGLHPYSRYVSMFTTESPSFIPGNLINVPEDVPTIQAGIDSASNGDTVLVWPGTYMENINFNGKNIVVGSLTLITGDTSYISQTVIRPVNLNDSSVVTIENGEDSTAVFSGFTIWGYYWGPRGITVINSSPTISHTHLNENWPDGPGGGIKLVNSNSWISYVKADSNASNGAGGNIYCENSNLTLTNVEFTGGNALTGEGIYCKNSNLILINVVSANGGDIYCTASSEVVIINSILWNINQQVDLHDTSTVAVTFSDVLDSLDRITADQSSTVYWLDGNINADPMFVDYNDDFRIQGGSPCIDAGIQDTMIIYNSGQDTLFVPAINFVGIAPDMGAYEFDDTPKIDLKQNKEPLLRRKNTEPMDVR